MSVKLNTWNGENGKFSYNWKLNNDTRKELNGNLWALSINAECVFLGNFIVVLMQNPF